MDRNAAFAALLPALLLYACDRAVEPPEPGSAATAPAAVPIASGLASNGEAAPEATQAAGAGQPTPGALTPEAAKGETGARDVLLSFARAIERKAFDEAWALLSPGDRQKWSRAEFTRMFAGLGTTTVAVPTGAMEGAAGSSYYTAPVTITANDRDGRPVRIEGEAVLRRVNDVDGASPEQLRWHFDRLTLDWTH